MQDTPVIVKTKKHECTQYECTCVISCPPNENVVCSPKLTLVTGFYLLRGFSMAPHIPLTVVRPLNTFSCLFYQNCCVYSQDCLLSITITVNSVLPSGCWDLKCRHRSVERAKWNISIGFTVVAGPFRTVAHLHVCAILFANRLFSGSGNVCQYYTGHAPCAWSWARRRIRKGGICFPPKMLFKAVIVQRHVRPLLTLRSYRRTKHRTTAIVENEKFSSFNLLQSETTCMILSVVYWWLCDRIWASVLYGRRCQRRCRLIRVRRYVWDNTPSITSPVFIYSITSSLLSNPSSLSKRRAVRLTLRFARKSLEKDIA